MCKYQKAYISFLDILGFSSLIKNRKKTVRNIYNNLKKFRKIIPSNKEELNLFDASSPISDAMITISFFNKYSHPQRLFFSNVITLGYIQCQSILQGILLRGALTYGDVFVKEDENILFGPSYIRSYHLESNKAKYPRILIDPKLYNPSKHKLNRYSNNRIPFDYFLYIDNEETSIDYIKVYADDVGSTTTIECFIDFIKHHKNLIEIEISKLLEEKNKFKSKQKKKDIDTIILKYVWLKKYHNNSLYNVNNIYNINIDSDLFFKFHNESIGNYNPYSSAYLQNEK